VQRFVLDHLKQAEARASTYDRARTVRGIAEAWVFYWWMRYGDHPDPGYSYDIRDWIASGEIELCRADIETVRRALKRLDAEGLVKLDLAYGVTGTGYLLAQLADAG
jgi:hypothetical protein